MNTAKELVALETPRSSEQRHQFRSEWTDIWRAPLHDFPIRDEILFQFLPLSEDDDVLDAGVGAGFTVFRLARQVHSVIALDVAPALLETVRQQVGELGSVTYACADLSVPGLRQHIGHTVDAAYALDVFEYVPDVATCLQNFAGVLRPGGKLLITFPNVPPPAGDGVTWFADVRDLRRLLDNAGFGAYQIFTVVMRPWPTLVYRFLHEVPLRVMRKFRRNNGQRPQTYENTWAFRSTGRLRKIKPLIHVYWLLLEVLMRTSGPVFRPNHRSEEIVGKQVVILASK